ncbi:bifunctional hydroxymethylpyrimidine kinase/phosphomethylpyrimidine kinase [Acidilobus sp. 7A]|uniref:bifunctional hydroxymethylpyrimidine kinase/phosphomethylpyrimidine kinase n=1 Tax=Acidilobus sp. 7A TaxID=1577685 RepID=UPI001B3BDE22|nr:bifunctional hydroxymethylpyrimidine kinase/phosphomethylpyrimidine kinase [Acidilobus sp. 7A]
MQSRDKPLPVAMTIAGIDSGGGAGAVADLKTFAAVGVHGTLAVTSVTAQNTHEVAGIYDVTPDMVRLQIRVVYDDMGIDAAKTGMLSNKEIVSAVAAELKSYDFPLVVDPVMVAKSGARLLREDAIETLIKELLPRATVVTPNAPEAERLSGLKVMDTESARRAAKAIADATGVRAVIVKGGHIGGPESVDILYYDGNFREYRAPRIETKDTHGTGDTFSAAIAAYLAKGLSIPDAVVKAKELVTTAIVYGLNLGKGAGPVNPTAWVYVPAQKYLTIEELRGALSALKENERYVSRLVPEIAINFGVAIEPPYARSVDDVVAVPGRITRYKDTIVIHGDPTPGASSHVARALLAYMRLYPEYRAAVNIALNEHIEKAVELLGLRSSSYDRREEPKDVKEAEGGSLPWGISSALRRAGAPVDVIYDSGDFGKEPGAFVFGRNAMEVAEKVIAIAKKVAELEGERSG